MTNKQLRSIFFTAATTIGAIALVSAGADLAISEVAGGFIKALGGDPSKQLNLLTFAMQLPNLVSAMVDARPDNNPDMAAYLLKLVALGGAASSAALMGLRASVRGGPEMYVPLRFGRRPSLHQ